MWVSEDSGDISGEVCWDWLSSLHALKFVDIVESGHIEQGNRLPDVCSECRKGMQEAELCLYVSQLLSVSDRFSFLHERAKGSSEERKALLKGKGML